MRAVSAPLVLGVDSGGSGLRVALAEAGTAGAAEILAGRQPVRTGPDGIDAGHMREVLLPMARTLLEETGRGGATVSAVVIGAAGMATLGDGLRAEMPRALAAALGARTVGLAADAVTAYAGALGQAPGAVVAAGTGMIAVGTDLTAWRRADGWGHLLGDCGSGAWIGRAGLEAALRAHDGRRGGSGALLARMTAVLGPPQEMPALLYPRTDRPAVLASFAPEVAACAARDGDAVAEGILARAAVAIAESAAAACPPAAAAPDGCRVSLTGGLFGIGDPLLVPLRAELARLAPHAVETPADGDPLAGALGLAGALATGSLRLPAHPTMLRVYDGSGRSLQSAHRRQQGTNPGI